MKPEFDDSEDTWTQDSLTIAEPRVMPDGSVEWATIKEYPPLRFSTTWLRDGTGNHHQRAKMW